MKKRSLINIIVLITTIYGFCQTPPTNKDSRKKIITLFKNFQFKEVNKNFKELGDYALSKEIFKYELDYYENGVNNFPSSISGKKIRVDYIDSIIYFNYLADYYYRRLSPDDASKYKNLSNGFDNCLQAFKISESNEDTLLINESLRRINYFFIKDFENRDLYKNWVERLDVYVQDGIDNFWLKYYKTVYKMTYSSFSSEEIEELKEDFLTLRKETDGIPFHKGILDQIIGNFHTYIPEIEPSRFYYRSAESVYQDSSYYSQKRKFKAKFSLKSLYKDEGKYDSLVINIEKLLHDPFVKNDIILQKMSYNFLVEGYDSLNNKKKRLKYLKLVEAIDKKIAAFYQAQDAYEISKKYEFESARKENQSLKKQTKSLKTSLMTIFPILGFITIILILTFYLYKRYKKKSAVLEEEQSETLQKLDELKKIVIKNHIVLKDKTKVYISDLMYIKSDDHYLEVHTQDDKTHTVRGKLSQIRKELPPNFIQCHRSYIVNSNFIKQVNSTSLTLINKETIPLSRSYKNRF